MRRRTFAINIGRRAYIGVGFSLNDWGLGFSVSVYPFNNGTDWEFRAALGPFQAWAEKP